MIKPNYNKNDVPYYFDFDDKGLSHSYPTTPPNYSSPQIIYEFSYEGLIDQLPGPKNYIWSVNPPFYILTGQGTKTITCELIPQLNINNDQILKPNTKISYKDYKYCELNLQIGKWKETLNLYYKQGPLWKIEGNKNPKINTVETYTLIPQYNQTGFPPKNSTDPNRYNFNIKNGKVTKLHGGIPPTGNPMVDILWYQSGSSYLSFYSAWSDEPITFPNTISIYVSE
jgi:hypothetical protein